MAVILPPTYGPRIEPRLTHYVEGDDPLEWVPLCGADVFTSITRSLRMSSTFSDCERCLEIRGQR